jgi:PPM family protein phosphatase
MSKTPEFDYFGQSDVGCVRETNEDAFGSIVEDGVFVVCDGMGGGAAGEVASSLAVESFLDYLRAKKLNRHPPGDEVTEALRLAILDANSLVLQRSRLSAEFHGMGTTLVALWVRRARISGSTRRAVWIGHVGDSRCYRFREGTLDAMTADHSLVEQQVRMGQMTPEEAERSNMRHVITRAVGVDAHLEPEVTLSDVVRGDAFLLCSDGLTREVTEARIAEVLAREVRVKDACGALIDEARKNGGNDNITCLLVRVH